MLDTPDIIDWIRDNCLHGDRDALLADDTPLLDDGVLDSMHIMLLVSYLEEQLDVSLPLEDVVPENFETPAAVAALAARRREKA